jgi:hypothetical protein
MTQNKGKVYKVAGLVVVDYVIGAVLRESGLEAVEIVAGYTLKLMRERDMNAESEYEESEHDINIKPRESH